MPSIDERVVSVAFENGKFETGVSTTMTTLAKLNASLANIGKVNGLQDIEKAASKVTLLPAMSAIDKLKSHLGTVGTGASDGFGEVERASNRVNLLGLNSAIDSVQSRFSALTVVATSALSAIVMDATRKGRELVSALSLGPITGGLDEYATNLNSIQTILANTEMQGTNLQDVNGALQDLNKYSDQTIYNFSQMAKNIGTFTAAGVELDQATQSIKGIANLAALSGSNADQASNAMYQLSQAIAAGRVSLQDWNSVVNAGMGGKVFQKALFDTGKAMGTITDSPVGQTFQEWEKAGNSFRESISANAKKTVSSTDQIKKAQKDAAESVANAEEAAAESVANAAQRVKDARKGVAEAAQNTAETVADANQSVVDAEEGVAEAARKAAENIKNAKKEVQDAEAGVAEAAKQSSIDIKAAVKAQRDAVASSAESVKSALNGVAQARKRLADAMKPPSADELEAASDRLLTAQLDQADLADAVTEAQREQTRAAEDLAAAQENLRNAIGADERASAQRAVEDAQNRVSDATDAVTRALVSQRNAARDVNSAQTELTETQKKGTKGDKNREDAQDALTQALKQYQRAQRDARDTAVQVERDVSKARAQGAQNQAEASARLLSAERKLGQVRVENSRDQLDAAKRLIDAEKGVSEARQAGAESEAEAAKNLIDAQHDQVKAVKDAQKQITEAHEQAAESVNQVRESMSATKGPPTWLTSDVLTTTLQQFTGDLSKAELKAKGFNDAQIKAIQKTAETARKAATEVKTIQQVFQVAKESIGSGWAQTFQIIFGNFEQAKKTFTGLSNAIQGVISDSAGARNKILKEWAELGGRQQLIEGLKNAFEALMSVLKPIHDAFRDIFPRTTGQQLFELTVRFREFMENLKLAPDTAENLKRTFRGLFAVVHIGTTIIKGILGVIFDLLGVVGQGTGGFLSFTGSIGDFLVAVDEAISKGKGLDAVFDTLGASLKIPLQFLQAIGASIASLFSDSDPQAGVDLSASLDQVTDSLGPLGKILKGVIKVWEQFFHVMEDIADFLQPVLEKLGGILSQIGDTIVQGFENVDVDKVLNVIQTGLIAGIAVGIKKLLGGIGLDLTGGTFGKFKETMQVLSSTLTAIQQNIKAQTMLLIAAAVVALAGAALLFSTIDPKKLAKAMTAISIGIGQLVGAMFLLTKATGAGAFVQLPFIAAAMLILASALVVLAGAVHLFARLSWEDLAKGLLGVAGALAAVGAATKLMGPGIILIGPGLIAVAIALNLLAVAMTAMGKMDWEELAKGMLGIAGALVAVGVATKAMGPGLLLIGPGLILTSVGLTLLAAAVGTFGNMNLGTLAKGIGGIAAALIVLGVAISAVPPTIALQAAGLVILGVALTGIAAAIGTMGSIGVAKIAKGLAAIAAALVIFAVGLTAMAATLPGSVALLAAAAAFAVLTPALVTLGILPWSVILRGLGAIAATLVVLAAVGAVAAPALLSLGVALGVMSISVLAVSAGIYLLAKGFSLLGEEGVKGVSVMIAALTAFIALIPKMVISFLKGIVDILEALVKLAPQIADSLVKIIKTFLNAMVELFPQAATFIQQLIGLIIKILDENAVPLLEAGLRLLVNFLSGIANNIGKVTEQVVGIITGFLDAMVTNAPKLVASGARALTAWLKGIADNIGKVIAAAANTVVKFLEGIVQNLPKVYATGVKLIVTYLKAVADALPKILAAGVRVIVRFIDGIGDAIPRIVAAGARVITKFLEGIAETLPRLVDAGFKAVIKFLNGVAKAIRENDDEMIDAGWNIASAIGEGLLKGLASIGPKVKDAIGDIIKSLPGKALDILGIHSPSRVFIEIGKQTMEGMAIGLTQGGGEVTKTMSNTADDVIDTAKTTLGKVPDILSGMADLEPVITPVLDLSNVRKGAQEISDLSNVTPITAAPSLRQAAAISQETSAAQEARAESTDSGPTLVFEQNNNSPESLSEIEIYRQTTNLLAQAKAALGV